jgi:hemoglobin-like flavoprotein
MSTGEQGGKRVWDYRKLFHESYLRTVVGGEEAFFDRFYERFITADPEVSEVFSNTEMHRQISMLQESLLYMIDFANSKIASQRIQKVASYHGTEQMNISPRLFDLWMDCLVETVRERDPEFYPDIETAWRVHLASGIVFLKSHCAS